MPVYNGGRFLGRALDSLLAQSCAEWELIVVDDGSTDGTPDVLAAYGDPRIDKVRTDNGGEARARNLGLERATGEFVAFLDADDLYLPNALADMSAYLLARPQSDALFADGYVCDPADRVLSRLSDHRSGIFTGDILEPLVLTADVITVPVCTLTRRAVLERHGIRFDEQIVIGVDWDFWIRVARVARFAYLDTPTCMYRVHPASITQRARERRRRDLVRGRMKVLDADWFGDLASGTQRAFLHALLVDLLLPAQRPTVLNHPHVRALPAHDRAAVCRQVATHDLVCDVDRAAAMRLLREAGALDPTDRKTRWLLTVHDTVGPAAMLAMLRGGSGVRAAMRTLRSLWTRPVRPLPTVAAGGG
jgi:GT2 family glycosyltransferase